MGWRVLRERGEKTGNEDSVMAEYFSDPRNPQSGERKKPLYLVSNVDKDLACAAKK